MTRWFGRALALVIVALLALGSGAGVASAAEGDVSIVPRSKLTDRPWRGVTLVTVAGRVVCTGFVVAPRKVVTAAHCLTRDASGGDYRLRKNAASKVRIFRAFSQAVGGATYRTCGVSRVWAHYKFTKRSKKDKTFGSRAHDYAVLTTKAGCSYPANSVMRMWETLPVEPLLDTGRKTRMAGYPADPRFDGMSGLTMWRTEGRVNPESSDPRMLKTSGFVAQGMSGAPVWRTFGKDSPCGRTQCVVAIVTECEVNKKGLCKRGDRDLLAVRITPTVKEAIGKR